MAKKQAVAKYDPANPDDLDWYDPDRAILETPPLFPRQYTWVSAPKRDIAPPFANNHEARVWALDHGADKNLLPVG